MTPTSRTALALLGVAAAAVVGGFAEGDRGAAGDSWGEGQQVEIELAGAADGVELWIGEPRRVGLRIDGGRLRLVDGAGAPLASPTGVGWDRATGRRIGLRCAGMPAVEVDGRALEQSQRPVSCAPGPVAVVLPKGAGAAQVWVDGQKVGGGGGASWRGAVVGGLVGASVVGLSGAGAGGLLLLLPLALLMPRIGLPVAAGLLLGVGAALVKGALDLSGTRAWLSGLLAAVLLVLAGVAVVRGGPAAGTEGAADSQLAPVLAPAIAAGLDIGMFQQKVDEAVAANRGALVDDGRPLVVAFGASSSGGGTAGRFWPQVLQEERPDLHIVSLAWGGATTWHLRRIAEALDVRADVCVAYIGHNDLLEGMPGLTLADLEAGRPAQGGGMVAPVPLTDAAANVQALAARCGRSLWMEERVVGREAWMAAYRGMLQGVDGAEWVDGAGAVPPETMMDNVHPDPRGQELLGRFVAGRLR